MRTKQDLLASITELSIRFQASMEPTSMVHTIMVLTSMVPISTAPTNLEPTKDNRAMVN